MDLFSLLGNLFETGNLLVNIKEVVSIIWATLKQSYSKLFGKQETEDTEA